MTQDPNNARNFSHARRQAPKLELVEWHSISIVRYQDGQARAWHNRIDLATRKLVSVRLADPIDPAAPVPWHILGLQNAAEELEVAHRMQQGLW